MNDQAYKKEDASKALVQLDFGKIFLLRDGDTFLSPFYGKIKLYESKGHLYPFKGKHVVTARGYIQLNKIASINVLTPQTIVVDGVAQPNPYVERERSTKMIVTVNVRKIGIGYSPIGNITIVDKTLFYNIYTYFIQSIQKKIKDAKSNKEPCAFIGTKQSDLPDYGSWVFYKTMSPLGIWVNYTDKEIESCLEDHTQRQRFGDRIAQTIVERNIYKDHPAIGVTTVEAEGRDKEHTAEVIVHGYRHPMKSDRINHILEQAEKGSPDLDIKAEVLDDVDLDAEKEAIQEESVDDKDGTLFDKGEDS